MSSIQLPRRRRPDRLGIYLHYPVCLHKCDYCDFFSLPKPHARLSDRAFVDGILCETDARRAQFAGFREVDSIFFGGGTPSLLDPSSIAGIIDSFRSRFLFAEDCEISIEANPENVTSAYLSDLHRVGVNRISVGIQSFSSRSLSAVRRFHDTARYADVLQVLADSPIRNRGVDLIFGLPEQDFAADLHRVIGARLEHLSLYSLTVEQDTPLARRVENEDFAPPDESRQAEILLQLPAVLERHGYHRYEISNYALPGRACRHNLRYWLYEPYMGLGPSAHGFTGTHRYANPPDIARWLTAPGDDGTELHSPWIDAPINLFRITVPFPHAWLVDILGERSAPVVHGFLARQETLGRGSFIRDALFQWTEEGLLFLDSILDEWMDVPQASDAKTEAHGEGGETATGEGETGKRETGQTLNAENADQNAKYRKAPPASP